MNWKGSLDKLLFVLVYLKQHPLQSSYGFTFAMSQSKVSQWLKVLLTLLEQALAKMRLGSYLAESLVTYMPAYACWRCRYVGLMPLKSQCRAARLGATKYKYSGKQGYQTQKNLLGSNEQNRILYLSLVVADSIHDKALGNEIESELLPEQNLLLDLGLVGYQPDGARTILLCKKPYQGKLSEYDKLYNRLLAGFMVRMEHVMAGEKRIRIVKDQIHLPGQQLRD